MSTQEFDRIAEQLERFAEIATKIPSAKRFPGLVEALSAIGGFAKAVRVISMQRQSMLQAAEICEEPLATTVREMAEQHVEAASRALAEVEAALSAWMDLIGPAGSQPRRPDSGIH